VANLRGQGDRDVVLQATNAKGYRVGRYVAAYAIDDLEGKPLWQTDHFGALAHGPLRVADLTGDGRDEICGFTLLSPEGKPTDWNYPPISPEFGKGRSFHIDGLTIEDVRPDVPGLEVVLLEEGRNYVGWSTSSAACSGGKRSVRRNRRTPRWVSSIRSDPAWKSGIAAATTATRRRGFSTRTARSSPNTP
jgi:hypothetical protein